MAFDPTNVQAVIALDTRPSDAQLAPPSSERASAMLDSPPQAVSCDSLQSYQIAYAEPALVTATSGSQSSNQCGSGALSIAGADHVVPSAEDVTNVSR